MLENIPTTASKTERSSQEAKCDARVILLEMNNNLDLSLSQLNLNRDQSQIDSLDGVSTMGGDSSNSLGS